MMSVSCIVNIILKMLLDTGNQVVSKLVQKCNMVRKLVGEGVTERLAKAAVQKSTQYPLDYDDCFIESLELESTEREAESDIFALVKEFDSEAGK